MFLTQENLSFFAFLTADALSAVLTKVNRMDIVTLLEGPIFDYGNVSGTRCFADDNAVFRDHADGKVQLCLADFLPLPAAIFVILLCES